MMPRPYSSCTHGEAAGLDPSFPNDDRICRAEPAWQSRECVRTKPRRTHAISCANDEFSSFHGIPSTNEFGILCIGRISKVSGYHHNRDLSNRRGLTINEISTGLQLLLRISMT